MSRTIDRIRKLLALSKDEGASENEAEVAGNLAARLMSAAGLSEADITDSIVDEVASVKSVRSVADKDADWKRFAAFASARMVGCRFYTSSANGKIDTFVWVGSDRQREAGQELYSWLVTEIERRAKIAGLWRQANDFKDHRTYVPAFKVGMAQAIAEKSKELVNLQAVTVTDSLALERKDKLSQAIDALLPKLGHVAGKNISNSAGMAAGRVQGASVELRKSVGSNGPRRLKG